MCGTGLMNIQRLFESLDLRETAKSAVVHIIIHSNARARVQTRV
jgi:hypothetical protein